MDTSLWNEALREFLGACRQVEEIDSKIQAKLPVRTALFDEQESLRVTTTEELLALDKQYAEVQQTRAAAFQRLIELARAG